MGVVRRKPIAAHRSEAEPRTARPEARVGEAEGQALKVTDTLVGLVLAAKAVRFFSPDVPYLLSIFIFGQ